MKNKIITILLVCFSLSGYTQSCDAVSEWFDVFKKEYPELKTVRYLPRTAIEHFAVNLYSDAYYVPMKGKSLISVSQKSRTQDFQKIQTCFYKGGHANDPHKNWVFQNIVYNYQLNFDQAFTTKISNVNALRNELNASIAKLKKGSLAPNEFQKLQTRLNSDFALLLPSEVQRAKELLTDAELETKLSAIIALPNDKEALKKLTKFQNDYQHLFNKTSTTKKQELQTQINNKAESILKILMPAEAAKIQQLAPTLDGINQLNTLLRQFNFDYQGFNNHKDVQDTWHAFRTKKAEIVKANLPSVTAEISNAKDDMALASIRTRYLSDLFEESNTYRELTAKIKAKEVAIAADKKRAVELVKLKENEDRIRFLNENGNAEGNMTFTTKGLNYAEFFDYVYRGHFENIEMKPESSEFFMIFSAYLNLFGSTCPDLLPPDKVEIMTERCSRERVTTNGYGIETSRICIEWETVGTGIFARPELYATKMKLQNAQNTDALRTVIDMYTNPNAMGNSVDQIHQAKALRIDMGAFFRLNVCSNPSIRHFEKNLRAFALGQKPLRLKGMSPYEELRIKGGPSGEQNFTKLIDDILINQSETWGFNQYVRGTITNVQDFKGADGKTIALKANYKFKGLMGTDTGAVTVRFKKGLPDCIIFYDFPDNCKKPKAALLSAYANGAYSK
ncbi:MAG: hypothetical protein RQ756_03140 [Flavobacteriaceae bacterium]|nr:hypothetical protein [Flavobacteriaceae bacterium]